ncbi:Dabb family protein [Microbacterium protaetiae]|uniref:Dabb family protein n=1 Tax=Microbacterium protaetiae TaxID=2509458 RepID=A0A4P6ER79_9MICO|nr:Dabb family protein [Microbacterium protaetiae]QAY60398.1 Dabb family protein [Microbacterium protaetiae]
MTLRHVVAWKMAAPDAATRAAQAQEIATRLNALVGVVPTIGALTAGANMVKGNWDVALVADFADKAALDAYAVHPEHQKVVAYVRSVVADRVAVDFEL